MELLACYGDWRLSIFAKGHHGEGNLQGKRLRAGWD